MKAEDEERRERGVGVAVGREDGVGMQFEEWEGCWKGRKLEGTRRKNTVREGRVADGRKDKV